MLQDFFNEATEQVDREMLHWLDAADQFIVPLYKAMRYSALAGGKRLRPALLLMTGDALGVKRDALLPAACALEMIHTYSLIHDDLPAMDNDDLRRGQPTNHKVFGEAIAMLAGDALLTLAFQVLASSPLPAKQVLAMVNKLAVAAGPLGMVGGQVADILEEGKPVNEARVQFIHKHKTGALIHAAAVMPAIAADVDEDTLARLSTYGNSIGLAFQIQDDILDVTGDTDTLGKTAGVDAVLQKATYPAVYGLAASRQLVSQLTEQAVAAIKGSNVLKDAGLLVELAIMLSSRDH